MAGPRRDRPLPSWHRVLATAAVTTTLFAVVGLSRAFTGSAVATEVVRPPGVAAATVAGAPATAAAATVRRAERVVVLGDSVAAASGCSCTGFGALLAADLAARTAASAALTNAAQDGLTTAGLLGQLHDPGLLSQLQRATLVTVTVGANDFDAARADDPSCDTGIASTCYGQQLTASTRLLSELFGALRRTAPQARILVTGYWNVFLDGDVARQHGASYLRTSDALTRALNGVIASQAQRSGLRYVDIYSPFKAGSPAALTALLAPDGDHPSAAGHRLIAAALLVATPATGAPPRGAT